METSIQQEVAEGANLNIEMVETPVDNTPMKNIENNTRAEDKTERKAGANYGKKPLTPYQQYKNSRNQNGKKYFEFYDDVKVYTHNIWDW